MTTELTKVATKLMEGTTPGVSDILRIGVSLAKIVETIPGMKGAQKMEAVMTCIREILAGPIKDTLTAEELQALHTAVDTVLPTTITLLIDASRAGDFLKKNVPKGFLCVPCFSAKAINAIDAPTPAPVLDNTVQTEAPSEPQVLEPAQESS
jgi:hypothetical protein